MPNATPATADQQLMEKLAQVEQQLVEQIYVPSFIDSFNKHAAAAGMDLISTPEQAERAIQLSMWVQANIGQPTKQAEAASGTGNKHLDNVFDKLAQLSTPAYAVSDDLRQTYAELVAAVQG